MKAGEPSGRLRHHVELFRQDQGDSIAAGHRRRFVIAILSIITGTIQRIMVTRQREQSRARSRRMSPRVHHADDASKLIAAAVRPRVGQEPDVADGQGGRPIRRSVCSIGRTGPGNSPARPALDRGASGHYLGSSGAFRVHG